MLQNVALYISKIHTIYTRSMDWFEIPNEARFQCEEELILLSSVLVLLRNSQKCDKLYAIKIYVR